MSNACVARSPQPLQSLTKHCGRGLASGGGARQDAAMRPTRTPTPESDANWNPSLTGHALFTTRLGVCGVAWGGQGVVAVMLPDVEPAAMRERLLAAASKRRTGDWRQALSAQQLSADALQAVAGVQTLLGGVPGSAGSDGEAWAFAQPQLTALGMVLPDLRAQFASTRVAPNGLPLLDDIAIDWHGLPEFAQHVYRLALAIAPGRTRSYGELAAELGNNNGRGLARAVGQALGANPFAPLVPCHRILASHGGSGGFSASGGTRTKLSLLEWEGAPLGDGTSLPLFG